METDNDPESPAKRALLRRGPCIAQVCSYGCDAYVQTQFKDGFNFCVCGHSQHAHAQGAVTA